MTQATPQSALDLRSTQPIELLKSGQLLALSNHASTGLILQKPFHAEFVGPGAAIGGMFDVQCVTIHIFGNAEFVVPETLEERQQAFQRRMEDIATMQQICGDVPLQRAVAILDLFRQRKFALDEIQTIPHDVLAKLVGVMPTTLEMAWQHQFGQVLESAGFENLAAA